MAATEKAAGGLMALPAELRNTIYDYALPSEAQEFRFSFGIYQPAPCLLQVCHQIRHEATGIYYSTRHFDLMVHHKCSRHLTDWIRGSLFPQARRALRTNEGVTLRVVFDAGYGNYSEVKFYLSRMAMHAVDPPWLVAPELHIYERVEFAGLPHYQLARKRELLVERSAAADGAVAAERSASHETDAVVESTRSASSAEESNRERAEMLLEEALMALSAKVDAALQG